MLPKLVNAFGLLLGRKDASITLQKRSESEKPYGSRQKKVRPIVSSLKGHSKPNDITFSICPRKYRFTSQV